MSEVPLYVQGLCSSLEGPKYVEEPLRAPQMTTGNTLEAVAKRADLLMLRCTGLIRPSSSSSLLSLQVLEDP